MVQPSNPDIDNMPGEDIDPSSQVRKYIKLGWSLVGAFFTLGVLALILKRLGLLDISKHPTPLEVASLVAFIVAVLNIGAWMYFPLADLEVQRRWIRSLGAKFPDGTTEFFMVLLALVLLLATIVSAAISPLALAVAGVAVYSWNFAGYAYVRKALLHVIPESRELYADHPEPGRTALLTGLSIVQAYFCVAEGTHPIRNRQQMRHLMITAAFALSGCIAAVGVATDTSPLLIVSYYLSACTFLASEISIGFWRSQRDRELRAVEEEWRRARRARRPSNDPTM